MLELYEPQVEDLWFKEKMMGDEQTMSYNHAYGGIIPFPKEYWADWHDRWITNHNGKRFYRYIKDRDTFVGEVAYHFDGERQIYIADVIIYAPYRGKGYGRKGLLQRFGFAALAEVVAAIERGKNARIQKGDTSIMIGDIKPNHRGFQRRL